MGHSWTLSLRWKTQRSGTERWVAIQDVSLVWRQAGRYLGCQAGASLHREELGVWPQVCRVVQALHSIGIWGEREWLQQGFGAVLGKQSRGRRLAVLATFSGPAAVTTPCL